MKKILLFGGALLCSLGFVNAQGWQTTGAHDDFATSTEYANGPNGQGIYWFDLTGGKKLALARPGNGAMEITATSAGGCSGCYPVFGVQFGNDNGTPYVLDLSEGANIKLDIETTSEDFLFMSITLEDVNGKKAEYEPNVSDLTSSSSWGDPERKSLNGFTIDGIGRQTITIDLSSVVGAIGGLSQNGAHDCDPGPFNCPPTSYQIDPSKIKSVLFTVNFGVSNIFLSEGDGDYTADTFLEGKDITPLNGVVKIHDFEIGTDSGVTGLSEDVIDRSLSIYPNPAKESLMVTFESANGASVSLMDIVGNNLISTFANAGENQIIMNTSELANGIYFLNVSTDNGVVTRKVVVE